MYQNGFYNSLNCRLRSIDIFLTKDYINFELDTFKINNSIIINTIIKNPIIKSGSGEIIKTSHQKYIINDLQVWIDNQRASDTLNYNPDSIMYDIHTINDISYFFRDKINIRPEILANHIFINRNNPFKQKDVDETFNGLSSLQIFKFINIGFIESSAPSENNDSNKTLDCKIQLITQNTQLIQPEFELTSNIGLGASGKLSYKHRNIFKGAEIFYIRLKGTSEAIKSKEKLDFKNTLEYSIESGIDIPKFVVPFNATMFIREYNPHTNISGSFNYIRRIHYTHQFFNTSFGYIWNAYKGNKRFQVNLIDLNYVKLLKYDSVFLQSISNSYLKYTFEDHLVSMSSFSYSYAKSLVKLNPFFYVRYNCEFAGNTLRTIMKTFDYKQNSDGSYDLFGIRYAQFIRSDIDFRYYIPIDKVTNIVFRTFVGVAYPYGNSRTIPFEKQYFAGGANSMRGWAIRSLGPGSYRDSVAQAYPDKASDLKIEANFEYRFKMFWKLEGALFVDIGNIWSISKDEKREGAKFTFSNFYNQFAVGSGIGTRLNFSFLIFRVDWGIKVIDPSQESKNKLVLLKYKDVNYSFWDIINPVIGIGYPF